MKTSIVFFTTLLIISILSFAGCDQSNNVSPKEQISFQVSPPDGAENVDASSQVIIEFSKPVDPSIVERSFHLISERDMADSLCPVSKDMNHGMMSPASMSQSTMMHLIDRHQSHGTFSWNDSNTKCIFTSDSSLTPNTQYMMDMGKEMMQMMSNSGMANCNCPGMESSDVLFHFRTRK